MKNRKISKFVYWTPRILSILFIAFLTLFSFDVITDTSTFLEVVVGLFMHNIPSIVLLITLIISWKHEIVGGIVFNLAGLLYIILLIFNHVELLNIVMWGLQISGIAFFIGILFIINWKKKSK